MARRPTISNEQILEAARAEFLEKGPSATTADIARRAGISEGSIFRRYESKEDLLIEAMCHYEEPEWMAMARGLAESEDLRGNLEMIAHAMLDTFRTIIPSAMLLISCRIPPHAIFQRQPEPMPARAIRTLSQFCVAHQQAGRMRGVDPEIFARQLISAMHFHVFCSMARINERMPIADATYVRGVVDTLLHGALAAETK